MKDRAFILSSVLGIWSTLLMDIQTSTAAHCPCTPSDADGHTLTLTGPSERFLSWCQFVSVNWFWAILPAAKDRAECKRAVKREIKVGVVTQKIQEAWRALESHREPQRATKSHIEPQRASKRLEERLRLYKMVRPLTTLDRGLSLPALSYLLWREADDTYSPNIFHSCCSYYPVNVYVGGNVSVQIVC